VLTSRHAEGSCCDVSASGARLSHRSVAPSSALLGTLAECTLPHEVVEPLEALALAELYALATSSTVLLTRSLPILSEFYLDVAADLVRALDDARLAASFDHVLDALTATWHDVHEVAAGVTRVGVAGGMEAQRLVAELAVHLVIDADTIRVGSRNALVRLLYGLDPANPIPPSLPENPLEFSDLAAFDVLPAGFWELIATGVRGLVRDLEETVRRGARGRDRAQTRRPERARGAAPPVGGGTHLRVAGTPPPGGSRLRTAPSHL
jgi:hypothetical protein